jgi:AcrR family transcriptional regulator
VVPRSRSGETRARILAVALELFGEQGVQQTSLQQIAHRLGITKPALYYHFDSREDLIRSLFQPMIDEVESFLTVQEAAGDVDPRVLLSGYFDLTFRYRRLNELVMRDLLTLAYLDLGTRVVDWRLRVMAMLLGPGEPTLDQRARAIVAIGGLADCTVVFADEDADELREVAVGAACSALGI